MLVAASGTVIEWFDFSLFFYLSMPMSHAFFPESNTSLLIVLATGAAGFLFRPLGAIFFGNIGDTRGRTYALVSSAILMAISLGGIAMVPSYQTTGMWGGVAILVLRCLAGFSVGGEYTGIMVYLTESAPANRRSLAASWAAANSEVGALLAVGTSALTGLILGEDALNAWGWRIPFVVGSLLALTMIPLRRFMVESPAFLQVQSENAQLPTDTSPAGETSLSQGVASRTAPLSHEAPSASSPKARIPLASPRTKAPSPVRAALAYEKRGIFVSFLISTVGSATYYLTITYLPTYVEVVGGRSTHALYLGVVAALAAIIATPCAGIAADRWGHRRSFVMILVATLALTVPGYAIVGQVSSAQSSSLVLIAATALLAAPAAAWSAVAASSVPAQFGARYRYSGMAIGYNIAAVLFGGITPTVVTWLIQETGQQLAPAYYAAAIALLAGIPALLLMRSATPEE